MSGYVTLEAFKNLQKVTSTKADHIVFEITQVQCNNNRDRVVTLEDGCAKSDLEISQIKNRLNELVRLIDRNATNADQQVEKLSKTIRQMQETIVVNAKKQLTDHENLDERI